MSDMTTENNNTAQEPDYLSMSDEEIMTMTEPVAVPQVEEQQQNEVTDEAEDTADKAGDEGEEGTADESGTNENNAEPFMGSEAGGNAPVAPKQANDTKADQGANQSSTPPTQSSEAANSTNSADAPIDYKAQYERILAPFKANGRDIKVDSVDDAITLMQMGANYNKKMAALKPNLKLLKMLENNNLLSEEKLSFLIDLGNRNPGAINKLVQDSGINPMDFDADKAGEYRPRIHTVDDRELALDNVIDAIADTPTYTRTLDIVSKEWDGASKQTIADHPELLQVINDHVASGIYDVISAEVERERMLGRLTGLSSIQAYKQVGDAIQARRGFDHLGSSQGTGSAKQQVVAPKPKADDGKLKELKRAASSSKPSTTGAAKDAAFNPLSMSDEEFEKLSESKFR